MHAHLNPRTYREVHKATQWSKEVKNTSRQLQEVKRDEIIYIEVILLLLSLWSPLLLPICLCSLSLLSP